MLRFYRDWTTDAPDGLTTVVVHRRRRPCPCCPPSCTAGPSSPSSAATPDRWKTASGLCGRSRPSARHCSTVHQKAVRQHQAMFDASFPEGWWYYFRPFDVATLTDEVIDITADHAQRMRLR